VSVSICGIRPHVNVPANPVQTKSPTTGHYEAARLLSVRICGMVIRCSLSLPQKHILARQFLPFCREKTVLAFGDDENGCSLALICVAALARKSSQTRRLVETLRSTRLINGFFSHYEALNAAAQSWLFPVPQRRACGIRVFLPELL